MSIIEKQFLFDIFISNLKKMKCKLTVLAGMNLEKLEIGTVPTLKKAWKRANNNPVRIKIKRQMWKTDTEKILIYN